MLTESFNETSIAIQNSGYATSHQVLFLVRIPKHSVEDLLIKEFQENMFTNEDELVPFSAAMVLYESGRNGLMKLLRYFCSGTSDAFNETTGVDLRRASSAISSAQQRHDHGMTVRLIKPSYNHAEEFQFGQKNLPIGMIVGSGICT